MNACRPNITTVSHIFTLLMRGVKYDTDFSILSGSMSECTAL